MEVTLHHGRKNLPHHYYKLYGRPSGKEVYYLNDDLIRILKGKLPAFRCLNNPPAANKQDSE
jgi:hypothetical protein